MKGFYLTWLEQKAAEERERKEAGKRKRREQLRRIFRAIWRVVRIAAFLLLFVLAVIGAACLFYWELSFHEIFDQTFLLFLQRLGMV